ncbi:MAG: hypothetical protein ACM3MB_00570 [Acidobacteriota bacterium]
MELRVKESHIEGLANHDDPESGIGTREGTRGAMKGESAGWVLSREKVAIRVPTLSTYAEGNMDTRKKGECVTDPARSKTPCMHGNSMRENRESLQSSSEDGAGERAGKNKVHNPAMDGCRKSDSPIAPAKQPNKDPNACGAAEAVEGRGLTGGKAAQQNISRTQCLERLSTAFYGIKKNAAAGVDGVTWKRYEEELEENLQDSYSRIHRGAYRARPSRRRCIPKPDDRQRPLGISSLQDKIVQRAVAEVLNAIYEADFIWLPGWATGA